MVMVTVTMKTLASLSCFDIEMYDSWGDGWAGNAIEIYEDGVLTSYANDSSYDANVAHTSNTDLDATTNSTFLRVVKHKPKLTAWIPQRYLC